MSSTLSLDYDDKSEVLAELERRRKARSITVTVDDGEIKVQLRSLNQPIVLFGEGPADRRERLRQILSKIGEDALKKDKQEDKPEDTKDNQETWYHEGSAKLRDARLWIADYSLPRARKRVEKRKLESCNTNTTLITSNRRELFNKLRNFEILCSQVGDVRPVSGCELSPDNQLIATSSWSGLCKLWSIDELNNLKTFRGHTCNVCAITFHPQSTLTQDRTALNLASCSVDGLVNMWNLENDEPMHTMKCHQPNRVSKLKFHPSGRFLATCCFDRSWRLFDLEHSLDEEILYQEGHSNSVYDIDFNSDGSLALTGGLDSFGRVWDLRTGRCIMFLEGHLKGILSVNFSPDGYHMVTGSEDHSAKVWNLREQKLEYTISAHTNVVSKVLFEKQHGSYILTSSFDNSIRLWASPNWTHIKTLTGHESKVTCADITNDNEYIVSTSFDRNIRIFYPSEF